MGIEADQAPTEDIALEKIMSNIDGNYKFIFVDLDDPTFLIDHFFKEL